MANKQDVKQAFNKGLLEALVIVRRGLVGGDDHVRNALITFDVESTNDLYHMDPEGEHVDELRDLIY